MMDMTMIIISDDGR